MSVPGSGPERRRILVVANETCGEAALCEDVRQRTAAPDTEVLMISPALTRSRLEYWVSDVDRAATEAAERLDRSLASLSELGVAARGEVGDAHPLQAIADALVGFPADEILVYTHPAERANWLERDLVAKARERFGLPVEEIVIDGHRAEETAR